jgi:hypothetical protein
MSVQVGSRYSFCAAFRDEAGRALLTEREPYTYVEHPDTRVHTVVMGDTLFALAGRYFAPLPRACGFWWVIADFQPGGAIVDPTLTLEIGRSVHIPSLRLLTDVMLSERGRSAP